MLGRICRCLLVITFSYECMGVVAAQPPTKDGRFAVEIRSANVTTPEYVTIPNSNTLAFNSLFYGRSLHRLENAKAGTDQPSLLKLDYKVEGDTVFITATVFYGDFDQQSSSVPFERLRRQTLATHSGRLNDSVAFPEMERAGLEPLALRIVTAQSDNPYLPLTRSDVPSVQIDYTPVYRTFGTVTLRNLSKKAVNAYKVGNSGETGSGVGIEEEKGGLCALIAPGSSYQARIGIPHSGRTVNETFIEDPQPQYLVLQSVLFADGSYEGDQRIAAEMAEREFGDHVQLVRIGRLARTILAEERLDDAAKIERIRNAIQQLSAQPDSEILAQFHAQFPAFSEDVLTKAESNISHAMKGESSSMDHLIEENEPILRQNRTILPLAQWWAAISECH